jgi:transposase
MKQWNYIGLDTHCHFTELAAVNGKGQVTARSTGPTTIPKLVEAIDKIPRPRALAFEEGPLAGWLFRNLLGHADTIVVCNPRRNALIAKESDKDDSIDAEKIAQLHRGGYLKPVHQPDTIDRAIFKQHVGLYHQEVRHRVREANRIMGQLRRWGVFVKEREFKTEEGRKQLLARLPGNPIIGGDFLTLFAGYASAVERETVMRQRLVKLARKEEIIRRWQKLPGISWIRGATFFVYLDTPWRFKSKSALWKYMGIGLERRCSGVGPTVVHVSQQANRYLKGAIIGGAKSAIAAKENPFAEQYRRWREQGLTFCTGRRNVARSLAVTMWSMWKSGDDYRPELVGASKGKIEG